MAKVLVSLNDALLRRIDRHASGQGLSRSAYLAGLAERDLEGASGPGRDPKVHAAIRRIEELFARNPTWGDSTALVRAERDARTKRLGR